MSAFYLLKFHDGPNDEQIWPYPVDEARPLPTLLHLGPDQYYVQATGTLDQFCHYFFGPDHRLALEYIEN